ncbi:MAG TPA: barstar family protein [Acidobacteriaceae bacterium]|jgi:RNAse (barnase) inhibitor barstar
MKELVMYASAWRTEDDFFDSFFSVVRAPSWHGRNFDALRDSIKGGQINEIEVPYRMVVRGLGSASNEAVAITMEFVDLVHRLAQEGCPVEIVVEA